jgi:distribution and morphology protein 10
MPSLNGSVGYIFTSCDLNVMNSRTVPFKEMIERFRVYDQPRRPETKEEVWHAGERVDQRGACCSCNLQMPVTSAVTQIISCTDVSTCRLVD